MKVVLDLLRIDVQKEGVSPLSNSCVGVENEDAKLWSCCFSESKILPKSMK